MAHAAHAAMHAAIERPAAGLAAGQPEFELEVGPHPAGELPVLEFEAEEQLSSPYAVEVTVAVPAGVAVEEQTLLGATAQLTIHLGGGDARVFHGIVAHLRSWREGPAAERLRARVVPRLWLLGQNRRSRVFQGTSAVEIVERVLNEWGVAIRKQLASAYPPREYCVQYDESDADFVSRLLEHEGIFYFFEHAHGSHVLVLGDSRSACPGLPGDRRLPFREPSRLVAGGEHVTRFSQRLEVRPAAYALRDYDFRRPDLDLTAAAGEGLEVYEYPGGYDDERRGQQLSRVRLEQERIRARTCSGSSASRRLLPGHVFFLEEHPIDGLDGEYLLVSVRHRGRQPEVLACGSAGERRKEYHNEFTCIPAEATFRPACKTARARVPGPQTATVVGPAGEEIHADEHGRVKVQFPWDREGRRDDRSSCWIRVSQAWAGAGWGALYLPRVGQEVVVGFLDGDPDRPIVTGAVYNGANPPPIDLPAEKTKSTLRSASSPGGLGSNELRFEDAAGQEQLYLHAERDLEAVVGNDASRSVGRDEAVEVGRDHACRIGGDRRLTVGGDEVIAVAGRSTLEVVGTRRTKVGGAHVEVVRGAQSVTVGGAQSITVGLASSESVGLAKTLHVGGAYTVRVGAGMDERVAGAKSERVGGSRREHVGADKSESIQGSRRVEIGGDLAEEVAGERRTKVLGDVALSVGGGFTQRVNGDHRLTARRLVLSAEDELLLEVGAARITLARSGDVTVKGARIAMRASGSISLTASSIGENS